MWVFEKDNEETFWVGWINPITGDFSYTYGVGSIEEAEDQIHFLNGGSPSYLEPSFGEIIRGINDCIETLEKSLSSTQAELVERSGKLEQQVDTFPTLEHRVGESEKAVFHNYKLSNERFEALEQQIKYLSLSTVRIGEVNAREKAAYQSIDRLGRQMNKRLEALEQQVKRRGKQLMARCDAGHKIPESEVVSSQDKVSRGEQKLENLERKVDEFEGEIFRRIFELERRLEKLEN